MKKALLALLLLVGPASAAETPYALYAAGHYDEAITAGTAAHNASGYAIAARAVLAGNAMGSKPCLDCLKRAESFAQRAMAADPKLADGFVWYAAALGLESRITGTVIARLHNAPDKAKAALDTALKDAPTDAYALSALGGWNMEVVRVGGAFLARQIYGADIPTALDLFDRATAAEPGNIAVHYQIALTLAGFDAQTYRARIADELSAAIAAPPRTAYEKFIQARAAELLALSKQNAPDAFTAKVHAYQGYL